MQEKKHLIIGAGPAGLSAGVTLARAGFKPVIVESSAGPGGLCRSFTLWGQPVDIGPHRFFTKNSQVYKLWQEMAGAVVRVPRCTRIYFNNRFFSYPLEAKNALLNLGIGRGLKCGISYLWAQIRKKPDTNFENWICNRFGRELYNTFFKTYSEKLWGIPCSEIHTDFAAQRIKGFTLGEAIKKAFGCATAEHKTAIEEFDYPTNGTGEVYLNMAKEIIKLGGQIYFNSPVTNIDLQNKEVHTPHQVFKYTDLMSSMPITKLVHVVGGPQEVQEACNKLQFRNTVLVYLELDRNPFPDNWIYMHSSELSVGRITNFSNWGTKRDKTIICMEYWTSDNAPDWKQEDEYWANLAKKEIEKLGYSAGKSEVYKIPKSYPVYTTTYKEILAPVRAYLDKQDIVAIGRYGSFRYNNQDHSILMGILAAENSMGAQHNLWEVNEDREYQENFRLPSKQ